MLGGVSGGARGPLSGRSWGTSGKSFWGLSVDCAGQNTRASLPWRPSVRSGWSGCALLDPFRCLVLHARPPASDGLDIVVTTGAAVRTEQRPEVSGCYGRANSPSHAAHCLPSYARS